MTEFIVESLADFEQAIASSERICFFFSASWDAASVQLADALGPGGQLAAPFDGRVNVVALDLGDADVEALALDLGVSAPRTAMLYRGGAKAATLAPATEATLAQALQELNQDEDALQVVRDEYKATALGASVLGGAASGCCGGGRDYAAVAKLVGYGDHAASSEANLGLGCGTPVALAALQPGELVLDLGSGSGLDCFLAADALQGTGAVVGVDMTPEMVARARGLAAQRQKAKPRGTPVSFRLGEIEHLPAADHSVHVVVSNCVVNLASDKGQVLRECFRVLKPGGRLAISDVVAAAGVVELPRHLRSAKALACWVAGAPAQDELKRLLAAAGFAQIAVVPKPASAAYIKDWLPGSKAEDFVVSADVTAVKPLA